MAISESCDAQVVAVKSVAEMTDMEAFARMWEMTAQPASSAEEMAKLRHKALRFVNKVAAKKRYVRRRGARTRSPRH